MPHDAPSVKIARARTQGAQVVLYDRYIERREDIAARIAEFVWRRRSAAAASIREVLQLESERIGIRETAPMMFRAEWRYRRGFVEP
jgi:hypothetical protein